jgi:DNA-binding FrmR family transcriptional regulator
MSKKVIRKKTEKERIIHRLKIARGHFSKLIDMVENDSYCIDLITQSLAIRKAMESVENIILKQHLRTCFKKAMTEGNKETQEEMINEIVSLRDYQNR